ncbi:MAG: ATP-binding protein [Campylobacterales bacterium]|nr:ATP-binding protein [Campylobacterales bacterium]
MISYLSFVILTDKYKVRENAINLKQITLISIKISDLVHELQKERGLSSSIISSGDSRTIFADKLEQQKRVTDSKYDELLQISNEYSKSSYSEKISNDIKKLHLIHNELLNIRDKLFDFDISKKELIDYYSNAVSLLLDSIYQNFKYTKESHEIEDALAYSDFLYAKEYAGILRAEAASIFIKDSIDEEERLKIANLIYFQNFYLERFLKFSDEDIKRFYNRTLDNKTIKEIKDIESMLLDSAKSKDFHVEGIFWFELMTKKIDNLKDIEEYFSKHMIENTTNKEELLNKEITNFTSIGLSLLIITFLIAVIIATNINNSLQRISKAILTLSDGSIELFKPIKINGENEFGAIANTLNSMVESLNEKDKINHKQNEELLEANQKAVQSVKAKAEFLANMSHEIRTPLNAILGFIDLLKEESKGRKSLKYVEIISSSSKSLLKIIEDILDFSKIESGKLNIDKIDFNTKAEFEVITYLFSAKCSQNNINLLLICDENMPQIINTDPLRVKQVISNLLSNAIKFSKEGKNIIVDISYRGNLLNVSVIDEGKGIASDKLSHIFESFSQEDSSTTREFGGTGLGLSISSELVKLLGGELKVKSEVGIGSEFYFSIPITIGKNLLKTNESFKDITFEDKKVLLVEDNKANQMFMKIILKKLTLTFDIANDGLEAVEAFKKNEYDAILMDENMPNLNGIEATKQIRLLEKEQNLKHTPIIALTANALKGDREKFLKAGMDEYVTKPIDKKRLTEILGIFLNMQETKENM